MTKNKVKKLLKKHWLSFIDTMSMKEKWCKIVKHIKKYHTFGPIGPVPPLGPGTPGRP